MDKFLCSLGIHMIFDAEVIEVKAKKDGLDKIIRIVLETNQTQALALQEYIAKDTIKVAVDEG